MRWIIATLMLLSVGFAQEPKPSEPTGHDASQLVRDLGSREFEVRDRAAAELKAMGAAAKAALEEGCKSSDLERSTRCKMLLKELGGDEARPLREVVPDAKAPVADEDAPPRIEDYRDVHEFIQAWQKHTDAMVKRLMEQRGGVVLEGSPFERGFQGSSKSIQIRDGQRVEVERDNAGIRVRIQPLDDSGKDSGDAVLYEAADEDAFRAQYPEIAKEHLGGINFRWGGGAQLNRQWPFGRPLPGVERLRPVPSGPRLGVTLETASADLCEHLSLPLGTQRITSVEPESLAQRLGMKVHDILLLLDGKEIRSVADVRAALEKAEATPEIEVQIMRKGSPLVLKGARKS